MYTWDILENNVDIQIIPEEEMELHEFNIKCTCKPHITKRQADDKIIYSHYSLYNGKIFEEAEDFAQKYYPLRKNPKDC